MLLHASCRAQVGMVFQNSALFDSLTVGDNVGFLLREHSQLPPARIQVSPGVLSCPFHGLPGLMDGAGRSALASQGQLGRL